MGNAPRYRSLEEMPPGMRRCFEQTYLQETAEKQAKALKPAPAVRQQLGTSSLSELAKSSLIPFPAFVPFSGMNVGADEVALASLNKTERRYYEILTTRHQKPDLVWIGVHVFRLRLAANTHYTPDFATLDTRGTLTMIDTKGGYTREDAQLKIKLAARMFPFFRWVKAELQLETKSRPEALTETVLKV